MAPDLRVSFTRMARERSGLRCRLKWSRLIADSGIAPRYTSAVDPEITAIVEDSRQVRTGACFVAVRGTRADGHDYVDSALRAGASAVVSERPVRLPGAVPGLHVAGVRGLAGRLAAVLCGVDELQRRGCFKTIGITGTNGKSTTCYLVRAILEAAGHPTALLGTIQYDLLSRRIEASMTTPPATALMEYLGESARAGATHAVMEVSSHALDQGRCDGLQFSVGVFTSFSGDHLDYHGDMASYLRAKKRLFDGLDADAAAVVNEDDEAWSQIVADCRGTIVRYRIAAQTDGHSGDRSGSAEIIADIREATAAGTRFGLSIAGGVPGFDVGGKRACEVASPLIGRHNVQNALAAVGTALALGVSLDAVVAGLQSVRCVPGRLQRVMPAAGSAARDSGFTVLVDYAHTDDALRNVLSALRPLTAGRLIVLFGCGGDRDRTKRPRMAAAVAEQADRIILTSDNPRTEDPLRIIEDVLPGFADEQRRQVHVEPDRRKAIADAVAMAEPGDVVLLAGKGHENYQVIGHEKTPFDDVFVAAQAMRTALAAVHGK